MTRVYVDSWNAGFDGLMPPRKPTAGLAERWRRDLLEPAPNRWWVAELDDSIVGFVGIGPGRDPTEQDPTETGLGKLDTIAVDPEFWRLGVGRTLMSVALRHLAADGYERGQRFYEATGWSPDGGSRDGGRQIRYRSDPIAPTTDE